MRAAIERRRATYGQSRIGSTSGPRQYRGAVLVGVAPGERAALRDLIESVRAYEGDDIKVVVADDLTGEYPDRIALREFPGVDFVRPRVPSGSSYCAFRTLQPALMHVVRSYRVPVILKCDPDSLLINTGAFDRAADRFGAEPHLGILGTTDRNASGRMTDYRWAGWMAHPELRWSLSFRRLVRAARAAVGEPQFAQAGGYFLSSHAVKVALERGLLPYHQPQWSLQVDDVIMDLVIQATGFGIGSFGAPGDPIASDNNALPLEPRELLERGFCVVHSVRSSPSGLSEEEVRAAFRAARSRDAGVSVGSV